MNVVATQSRWRPVVRGNVGRHELAPDARPLHVQLMEYVPYAACIHATAKTGHSAEQCAQIDEGLRKLVIDALCLCEDVHGYAAICDHVFFVAGLIACAEVVLPGGFTRAAVIAGYTNIGMLVGLLVEQLAGVSAEKRKFLPATASNQDTSPHLIFADCVLGTSVARQLDELAEDALDAGAPFASLAHMARRAHGAAGRAEIRRLSDMAAREAGPANRFITLVLASDVLRCAQQSVVWNSYVTMRMMRT